MIEKIEALVESLRDFDLDTLSNDEVEDFISDASLLMGYLKAALDQALEREI